MYRLEEHQAQGFRARDDKTREVERLKTELEVTRREASDVSNKAALKVRESEQTIAQAKSLVHQREMEMGERRARLEGDSQRHDGAPSATTRLRNNS